MTVPLLSRAAEMGQLAHVGGAAGLTVRHELAGPPVPLPGPVDQTAYRIVQEALTNAVRHAGPGSAVVVRVEYGDRAVRVIVDDDGRGQSPPAGPAGSPGGGNGLPGMRERVRALGGKMAAGPRPGGGFRVEATLPLPDELPPPDGRPQRTADATARSEP